MLCCLPSSQGTSRCVWWSCRVWELTSTATPLYFKSQGSGCQQQQQHNLQKENRYVWGLDWTVNPKIHMWVVGVTPVPLSAFLLRHVSLSDPAAISDTPRGRGPQPPQKEEKAKQEEPLFLFDLLPAPQALWGGPGRHFGQCGLRGPKLRDSTLTCVPTKPLDSTKLTSPKKKEPPQPPPPSSVWSEDI